MLHVKEDISAPGPPIYQQIARVLRSRIFHGLYSEGTAIPSEHELAQEFGVARLTVRQAIDELRREGALVSRRGSGTFVPPGLRIVRPVHFIGYLEDYILQSLMLRTQVTSIRSVSAPSFVRGAYGLPAGAKVVRLIRIRFAEAKPAQYSVNYLRPNVARKLSLETLGSGSLSEMLARQAGIETDSASQTITAVAATAEVARALDLRPGTPLLASAVIGFSGPEPVHCSQVLYRPDHVYFTATLTSVMGDTRLGRPTPLPGKRRSGTGLRRRDQRLRTVSPQGEG